MKYVKNKPKPGGECVGLRGCIKKIDVKNDEQEAHFRNFLWRFWT